MSTRIFVGGLAKESTAQDLNDLFSNHGIVTSVSIVVSPGAGKFAYVEMDSSEAAQKSITSLHGKELGGKKLTINQTLKGRLPL